MFSLFIVLLNDRDCRPLCVCINLATLGDQNRPIASGVTRSRRQVSIPPLPLVHCLGAEDITVVSTEASRRTPFLTNHAVFLDLLFLSKQSNFLKSAFLQIQMPEGGRETHDDVFVYVCAQARERERVGGRDPTTWH